MRGRVLKTVFPDIKGFTRSEAGSLKRTVLLAAAVLIFSGCGATNREELQRWLDSRIGQMTYDDALVKWGAPKSVAQGDKIFVVRWEKKYTETIREPYPMPYPYPWYRRHFITRRIVHGWELQLYFDRTSRKLENYRYTEW